MFRVVSAAAILLFVAFAAGCGEATPKPPTPAETPTLREPFEQLTYTGPDGELRLVDSNGANDHVLVEDPCSGSRRLWGAPSWTRDGGRLAYVCGDFTLMVVDASGLEIARAEEVDTCEWSPDGQRLALERSEGEWPDQSFEVSILDMRNLKETVLAEDARLLEWIGGEHVMLQRDLEFNGFDFSFRAYLHDLTGGSEPMPRFDNQRDFWVTSDGDRAIVLAEWDEQRSGFRMAVYDFATGEEMEIEGSAIGYPSEHIPDALLALSRDASTIYWANPNATEPVLWQASTAGGAAQRLSSIGSSFAAVSPGGRVAYWGPPPEPDAPERGQDVLIVEDAISRGSVEITRGGGELAWRTPGA